MNKENARLAKGGEYIEKLDEVVKFLQECKRIGKNVYVEFNGIRLYSCDVTMRNAYLQVTGLTKLEFIRFKRYYEKHGEVDEIVKNGVL